MTPIAKPVSPASPAHQSMLSADNRFTLMPALRQARTRLGLSAQVLSTLEAMLTCLPRSGGARVVFASNETLSQRRNGVTDRTIRRHIRVLVEAGLARRNDSPNGKRYSRRNPMTGDVLRFGVDLSPLFDRGAEIEALAQAEIEADETRRYLKSRIKAVLALHTGPIIEDMHRRLRQKLSLTELEGLLARVTEEFDAGPLPSSPRNAAPDTPELSATDSHSVRHHQRSTPETQIEKHPASPTIIAAACPFPMSFSESRVGSEPELVILARTLAPMLGISERTRLAAEHAIGPVQCAKTVLVITQMKSKVRNAAAYFHSVTLGKKKTCFDPDAVIRVWHERSMGLAA